MGPASHESCAHDLSVVTFESSRVMVKLCDVSMSTVLFPHSVGSAESAGQGGSA